MVFKNIGHHGQLPPAKRKGPTRSETDAKQGKPKGLPETAGEPQGTLRALGVEECGKSEGSPVTGGIRAATLPDTKVCRLPRGDLLQESLENLPRRE